MFYVLMQICKDLAIMFTFSFILFFTLYFLFHFSEALLAPSQKILSHSFEIHSRFHLIRFSSIFQEVWCELQVFYS